MLGTPSVLEPASTDAPSAAAPSSLESTSTYARRRPELGTLHQIVRDNLLTLYAAIEQGLAAPLPAFVRNELALAALARASVNGLSLPALNAAPGRPSRSAACRASRSPHR